LSTVRIYKVAELLNSTSQEVVTLLKRDHGIDVKSASSTIEEVVARQFVERHARQRGITLPPPAQMFLETAAPPKGAKKAAARAPEPPPKPAAPAVGPPRLVRTITPRPAPLPVEGGAAADAAGSTPAAPAAEAKHAAPPAPPAGHPPVEHAAPPAPEPIEVAPAAPEPPPVSVAPPTPEPVVEAAPPAPAAPEPPAIAASASPAADAPAAPVVESEEPAGAPETREPAQPAAARPQAPFGRVVPPTLRLRIEDPGAPQTEGRSRVAAPPRLTRPAPAQPSAPAAPAAPQPAAAGGTGTPPAPRPPLPGAPVRVPVPRPPGLPPARPASQIPGRTMVMGPGGIARPTYQPTGTPIRPSYQPGARPGTPGQPTGLRPPTPGYRPPGGSFRPGGSTRPSGPRRDRVAPGPVIPQVPAGPPPITRSITLAEGMTVKDLSDKLEVRVKDVLKKLIDRRMMMTINTTLDTDTATMIAREFGADVKMQTFEEELLQVETDASKPEDLVPRAPVVTVMGHVDHGKTTLLDAIRETRVADREAGGITQHIGAYAVELNKRKVVFLDTPGHEAFTSMRARGAKVTDVVILVVAADDGVMPQTKEAIDHARAANVKIIVAINKVDKPDANPERVKQALTEVGLLAEDWGGDTVMVPVSAKKRENLDALLEMVLLVADLGEYKANPKRAASGTVLEAKLDRGRGAVATILVQDGSLSVGDTVIAGTIVGKVRALIDDHGRSIKTAGPSTPVEVLGLPTPPSPGDTFQALADAAKARQIALFRQNQMKERSHASKSSRLTLESLKQQIAEGGVKELPIIVKADVQGSAEVLASSLQKLGDERVKVRIIHAGVGAINEFDVLLALTSNAIVIGFNVRPDRNASEIADREKVDVRLHSVIYNVTDEIKKAMAGILEPTLKEVRLGSAEVRQIFKTPKFGTIGGCMVTDGVIKRSGESQARLLRDNVQVYEGKLGSLRRFKDDVSEVKAGFECGIGFESYNDLKVGDVIEVFTVERVAATIS
jgi:translation initiation factor IF-2